MRMRSYNSGPMVGGPWDGDDCDVLIWPPDWPDGVPKERLEVRRVFSRNFPEGAIYHWDGASWIYQGPMDTEDDPGEHRDAPNCIDGGVLLRTICGKFGHAERDPCPKRRSPHVEDVLARLYVDESEGRIRCAVAKLCDEELDKSGGLLGRVRDRAAKLGGKGWAR